MHSGYIYSFHPRSAHVGDITALCLDDDERQSLLVGTGGCVLRCSLDEEQKFETWRIFKDGSRVHGISKIYHHPHPRHVIYGGRKLKLVELVEGQEALVLLSLSLSSWILATVLLDGQLAVGLSNNSIEILDIACDGTITHRANVSSSVNTQLVSLSFQSSERGLRIASGTMFGSILIWRVDLKGQDLVVEPELTLAGHEGVVFSLSWCDSLLSSTSDDRTCRIWDLRDSPSDGSRVSPTATLFHTSRVWASRLIGNEIVATATEDNKVILWNLRDMSQVAVLAGHRGKGIWCLAKLDIRAVGFLVSGGADGRVRLWRLSQWLQPSSLQASLPPPIPGEQEDWIRCLSLSFSPLARRVAVFTATHQGTVRAAMAGPEDNQVALFSPLLALPPGAPITCISTRAQEHGRYNILVGNKRGEASFTSLTLQEDGTGNITVGAPQTHVWQVVHHSALLSITWAELDPHFPHFPTFNPLVLTIASDCSVGVWSLGEASASQLAVANPTAKRRTVTCACLSSGYLVTGDIEGGVSFYRFPLEQILLESVKGSSDLELHRRFKAHSGGVSDIRPGREAGSVVTVGHDSAINIFYAGEGGGACVLHGGGSHRIPITQIQVVVSPLSQGRTVTAGFHSSDWIVYDAAASVELMRVKGAGGFKRAHCFNMDDEGQAVFAFCSDKRTVEIHRADLFTDSRSIKSLPGTHGREINCVLLLEDLVLTGSEDGAIRSLTLAASPSVQGQAGFSDGSEVGEHSSEVRCFDTFDLGSRRFLVSGGSKQQLALWEISHPLKLIGSCYVGALKGGRDDGIDNAGCSELRVMDLTCLSPDLIIVALSNSVVEVMRLDLSQQSIELGSVWRHSTELPQFEGVDTNLNHPTLSMGHLAMDSSPQSWLVFAGRTDGSVRVWRVGEEMNGDLKMACLAVFPSVHQSGINGLVALRGLDQSILVLVTAGDDQALATTSLTMSEHGRLIRLEASTKRLPTAHSSAVKALTCCHGSRLTDCLLFTVGLDQRLRTWSIDSANNLILVASRIVDVLEPCAISSSKLKANGVSVVVAGRGVEALEITAIKREQEIKL